MSAKVQYIELNSSFRDRNQWPSPAEFATSLNANNYNQVSDPVSLSTPIISWTSNFFSTLSNPAPASMNVYLPPPTLSSYSLLSDIKTFTLSNRPADFSVNFQQKKNYYRGAVLNLTSTTSSTNGVNTRRIKSYEFLGATGGNSFGQFTPEIPLGDTVFPPPVNGTLTDSTSIADTSHPVFYVPSGFTTPNAYSSFILYNESLNQYRQISDYDNKTYQVKLGPLTGIATSISGPVSGWATTDNYSIRKQAPLVPSLGVSNPTIQNITIPLSANGTNTYISTTSCVIILLSSNNGNYDRGLNAYRNSALRIIPNNSRIIIPSIPQYYTYTDPIYSLPPPLNESRIITSSFVDSTNTYLILLLSKPFDANPAGYSAEILGYSQDNSQSFLSMSGNTNARQNSTEIFHEVKLLNIIIPNKILSAGLLGGYFSTQPILYVELSNYPNTSSGHFISSNNPKISRAVFRILLKSTSDSDITPFIFVDHEHMKQCMIFRPEDSIYFALRYDNGSLFTTSQSEWYAPQIPNPEVQISAMFEVKSFISTSIPNKRNMDDCYWT